MGRLRVIQRVSIADVHPIGSGTLLPGDFVTALNQNKSFGIVISRDDEAFLTVLWSRYVQTSLVEEMSIEIRRAIDADIIQVLGNTNLKLYL